MCGRFARMYSRGKLIEKYRLKEAPQLDNRYNIAPQQPVAAVRTSEDGRLDESLNASQREADMTYECNGCSGHEEGRKPPLDLQLPCLGAIGNTATMSHSWRREV